MGLISLQIYLDACVVIYLVEEHPTFARKVESLFASMPDYQIYVSDLTALECLIMPLRNKNRVLIKKYEDWFQAVNVLSLGKSIFKEAA